MNCKICATEFAGAAADVFCPACRDKLRAPGGGAGSFTRTPVPQPAAASAPPTPAPRNATSRQLWVFTGDLKWPLAAAAHPAGGAVVLDQPDGYRVLHLSPEGVCQAVLFSIPQGSEAGQLDDPQGFCLAGDGALYVADSGNDRISIWDADGAFRQVLGDLARPSDVRVDEDGFLYVADSFNRRALKLSPEGLQCLELADAGGWGRLTEPVALDIDRAQNIYVADRDRGLVVQFSSEGVPVRCWPGKGAKLAFEQVRDVKVGADGSVWIGDRDNTRVHRFAASGGLLTVLERLPEPDLSFEGGTMALLDDNVVVPDRLNDRVVCLTFGA
jgi:sugar lactone lactonase YvrE